MEIRKKPLGIYIHIPFCIRKCYYCDFLSAPGTEETKAAYVKALLSEISGEAQHYKKYQAETVFLGGGTPSLLSGGQIAAILECIRAHYVLQPDAEITMEINPGTVTKEKLKAYRQAGINRLSVGLQSTENEMLQYLGRVHNYADFLTCWEMIGQAGFSNRNLDLMSALPGQSLESYERTLHTAVDLQPEHISAYSLILEEGTPFYAWYQEGADYTQKDEKGIFIPKRPVFLHPLPDEDVERRMYELTGACLEAKGYGRYEISNYAKKGYACRHNTGYWQRRDYAGFGLGAASLVENVRFHNTRILQEYLQPFGDKKRNVQSLDTAEQMEEFMFLGLRLMEGVTKAEFYRIFEKDMEEVYGKVLAKLSGDGLLINEKAVRLTARGIDVSNYALSHFLF